MDGLMFLYPYSAFFLAIPEAYLPLTSAKFCLVANQLAALYGYQVHSQSPDQLPPTQVAKNTFFVKGSQYIAGHPYTQSKGT